MEEEVYGTIDDLIEYLETVFPDVIQNQEALYEKLDTLQLSIEEMLSQVQLINIVLSVLVCFLGVVVGILLMQILWERFSR